DLYSHERREQIIEQGVKEKVSDKLYQAEDFFRYHVEWGRNDFGSAKYCYNVEEVLELLTGLVSLGQKDLNELVDFFFSSRRRHTRFLPVSWA
ncbi:hypothetical protein, partial [Streptococcus suis]